MKEYLIIYLIISAVMGFGFTCIFISDEIRRKQTRPTAVKLFFISVLLFILWPVAIFFGIKNLIPRLFK
jgi:heme O synthase-like polyprenyltransferase